MLAKGLQHLSGEVQLRTNSRGSLGSFGSRSVALRRRVLSSIGAAAAVAALLIGLIAPSSAAAAGGASPDPAPSGGASAATPLPDPSPQAGAAALRSSPSSSHTASSSTPASVVSSRPVVRVSRSIAPAEPATRIAITPSAGAVIAAPSSSPVRAHPRVRSARRRTRAAIAPISGIPLRGILLAPLRGFTRFTTPPTVAAAVASRIARHAGPWLLLSAIALVVLVIASGSMLRLLRLNGHWWETRSP